MENVEHTKVENTSSSPNTKQNDCFDDEDEHVINQNQQLLDKLNTDANVALDLTESSCATKNEINDSCLPKPIALPKLVGEREDASAKDEKSTVEPQAPVDLTNVNTTQINSASEEVQIDPFSIKKEAVLSENTTNDDLNISTPNDTLDETLVNSLVDLHTNSISNQSSASAEAVKSNDVSVDQNEAVSEEAVDSDKTKEGVLVQPDESILDLSTNSVHEGPTSPINLATNQTYQRRLSEIKIEKTLESQESAFYPKEKQTPERSDEIMETAIKLNGSHRYSPEQICEESSQDSSFVKRVELANEKSEFGQEVQPAPNDVDMLNSSLVENTQQQLSNHSFSSSLDNLAEQSSKTLEEANDAESTNEFNESRYSSSDSLNSASTLQSSSSHQLIIDQIAEDEKVPPLRLKLKRKHRKSSSSVESAPIKRANIEETSTVNSTANDLVETIPECNSSFAQTNEKMLTRIPPTDVLENSITSNVSAPADDIAMAVTSPPHEMETEPIQNEIQAEMCGKLLGDNSLEENLNPLKPQTPSQYYKCTACGTYHENWSFFLHLQEKHDRFLCLYCIKCFPTAEKLALHLEIKHDLEQNHFNTEEAFRNSALIIHGFSLETRFLMCCTCQYIFRENAAFTEHACIEFMKSCTLCGQKGRHTNQCKANPMTKRRNKKKTRQKAKPPSPEPLPQIEATLKPPHPPPPPPPAFTELEAPVPHQQQEQEQIAQKTPVRRQTEDSNSSSNMVIDESCNTNHSLLPYQINPFKALDDSERMEREEAARKEEEEVTNAESLINSVFKFKLRVPKEFQKPVDEEISTSESEHGEVIEDEVADINSNQIEVKNNVLEENKTTTTPPPAPCLAEQQANVETPLLQSEDESVDDTAANAQLARILQEIEQTKLDIEKTRETLHQRNAPQPNDESTDQNSQMADESNVAASADVHWTPTPPASPNLNAGIEYAKPADIPSNEENMAVNPESEPEITELMTENMDVSEENASPVEDFPSIESVNDSANDTAVVPALPDDGIEVANEDCMLVELQLDRPLDQFETVELVRICLKAAYPYCLYCNHARRIAVHAENLVLHLIAQHRFMATVDSITAEELQPSTLVAKLKSFLPELQDQFMNSSSYCTIGEGRFTRHFNERIFECFQCRFVTSTHKELYLHNRKMHLRTAILCFMCRCNFYSFSEILCHICPGIAHRVSIFEIKFRCCLCDLTEIPSPFRLMVHLRKRHFACDICLEDCRDQSKLSSHVWKHKLHHLCYRCGIAYRNKLDITKHLFWKHGTESALCKRCLQKRWPHVYHFCVPPAIFSCDVCQLCFSKAMYLTVHKRLHQNDFRYACTEANCQEKYISRKLLLKHSKVHELPEAIKDERALGDEPQQKLEENVDSELNEKKPVLVNDTSAELGTDAKVKTEIEGIKNESAEKERAESEQPSATPTEQQPKSPSATPNMAEDATPIDQPSNEKKHKKRKKRAKESLEDLNLTAPNLSESGSSSESESETKSTTTTTRHELALSPLSEHGDAKLPEHAAGELQTAATDGGSVLDIWKNFLQAQQQSGELQQYAEYTEDNYPAPKCVHVCTSDHDYCAMFAQAQPSPAPASQQEDTPPSEKHDLTRTASTSSDASSDDSSSSSSCSCGSNCSCSNGSSSSSSSGDSSDSSVSATRKRLRKKSERSNRHRKSFSSSPLKQQQQQQAHNASGDNVNVIDTDDNANVAQQLQDEATANAEEVKTNLEPTINESDLETAESETDEEYYDEHPQKLATELLSQKRAQLMARTLLSPSHNFDIVENSRPSTPSLPEDVIYEKRQKKKKNKRDRKSTSNSKMMAAIEAASAAINETHEYLATPATTQHSSTMEHLAPAPVDHYSHNQLSTYMQPHSLEVAQPRLAPNVANHHLPRISEGSSCSDADYSLKRSKRQRRPNKFYGYTSDDESMAPAALGQSLVIGMRAYKPLPPPLLVWDKEDLPTPEKSILNVNKKTTRQLSTPNTSNAAGDEHSTRKRKTATHRKRSGQHSAERQKLPPIPRLKIRSALFNKSTEAGDLDLEDSSDSASSEIEQHATPPQRKRTFPPKQSAASASFLPRYPPNQHPQQQQQQQQMPVAAAAAPFSAPPPLPPTPQTTAFNHKIPPALLPNPDFATLQYFKANNIRYPIRPPAGARAAREGESVYCYCRCPYDEVSEMIACDGDSCLIEWFHFECVGIMLAPQGKWFCAECRPQYSEELYPTTATAANTATNLM